MKREIVKVELGAERRLMEAIREIQTVKQGEVCVHLPEKFWGCKLKILCSPFFFKNNHLPEKIIYEAACINMPIVI